MSSRAMMLRLQSDLQSKLAATPQRNGVILFQLGHHINLPYASHACIYPQNRAMIRWVKCVHPSSFKRSSVSKIGIHGVVSSPSLGRVVSHFDSRPYSSTGSIQRKYLEGSVGFLKLVCCSHICLTPSQSERELVGKQFAEAQHHAIDKG